MNRQQFHPGKFQELILYIAHKSETDPNFGIIKLNKILYYADFNAFRLLGRSVTGAEYRKLTEGPAPAEMPPTRRAMLDQGLIKIESRNYFNSVIQRTVALRKPNTNLLTLEELLVADEAIWALKDMTERQAAALSREEIGWKAARHGETIPYQTAWLSADPLPQEAEEYWRDFTRNEREGRLHQQPAA